MGSEVRATVGSADELARALLSFVRTAEGLADEAVKVASQQEAKAVGERDARLRALESARRARQRADAALAACAENCQGLHRLAAQARVQEALANESYRSSVDAVAVLAESRARISRGALAFRAALERAAPGGRNAAAYRDELSGYLRAPLDSRNVSMQVTEQANSGTMNGTPASVGRCIDVLVADVIDDRAAGVSFEKVSRPQVEWGLDTLARVIQPAVQMGKGSEYFAERDRAEGLAGERSYSGVYRWFYGDNHAIKLSRHPDGKLEIVNGYHRVAVARDLGIRSLPAVVR